MATIVPSEMFALQNTPEVDVVPVSAVRYSAPAPVLESADLLAVAGLLVGFGTRLGSGCTSGHGVCGIARLSPRSLIATGVFMATAAATVFLVRHVIGA